jgi:hypothetical protein
VDEFTTCAACSRTPLVGERVTLMSDGSREAPVCELCSDRPRAAALGEPVRRERIRSAAGASNVRRLRQAREVGRPTPAGVPAAVAV